MNSGDLNIYREFIYKVVTPFDNDADEFFFYYRGSINEVATKLLQKNPVTIKTLYRGLLLDPSHLKKQCVEPLPTYHYLSFSENIKTAIMFANIESWISRDVKATFPDYKGFLVEHIPTNREILFHYSWCHDIGLDAYPRFHLAMDSCQSNREVILHQSLTRFPIKNIHFSYVTPEDAVAIF